MKILFCNPDLTMNNIDNANLFFYECKSIISNYVTNLTILSNEFQINMVLSEDVSKDDIFIFFNSENGQYSDKIQKLIYKYNDAQSRIWPIAMIGTADCRKPPEPLLEKQSFDIASRLENRHPSLNNMKAIAQIFSRKIVAQSLSPLYRDEVLYFVSHKRSDGEAITALISDELKKLTRERNIYRDVVNVEVGQNAQRDIDEKLAVSDVLIFIQTKEASSSDWIMKELCYALVNDIPVLWIQIDNAPYNNLQILPGECPNLKYSSSDFFSEIRLEEIANEIEEYCFNLIMNTSNQVSTYIEYLYELNNKKCIMLRRDEKNIWAYEIEYSEKTKDRYDNGKRCHYIQCFGRNPKEIDIENFFSRIKGTTTYDTNQKIILLSNHGSVKKKVMDEKLIEENYDDYIMNIENVSGKKLEMKNKRIIISGAFPDGDEIYQASLREAVIVYAREILKNGYTLVFGAHPTFQKPILEIGNLYTSDAKKSIEMHMDKKYISEYDKDELEQQCTLILSDGLQKMREQMICGQSCEMMICLGGKIKKEKSEQGIDVEIELAKKMGVPIALVGTVGGRSAEIAYERIENNNWNDLNSWDESINKGLFYNVNHRLMIRKLLELL